MFWGLFGEFLFYFAPLGVSQEFLSGASMMTKDSAKLVAKAQL